MWWFSILPQTTGSSGKPRGLATQADRLLQRARGSHYVRSVAVLVGGTALGQALVMLASPILTRVYSPADFGVLAIYTAVLAVITIVSAMRYEITLPMAKDEQTASNLMTLGLLIILVVSSLVALGVWVAGETMAGWINAEELRPYLWLLPVGVLGGGVYRVLSCWAIRKEIYGSIARTRLTQSVSMIVTQVGLGLVKAGPLGLLLGWIAGQSGGSGALGSVALRIERETLRQVSFTGMREAGRRYLKLVLFSSGSAIVGALVVAVPPVFFAASYGLAVAGAFALGQRVMAAPMELIAGSMSQVYWSDASRLAREEPAELRRLFIRTVLRLSAVGGLPILVIALASPWVFSLVFGSSWREAGVFLQVLAPMLMIQFVYNGLAGTLEVIERQDLIVVTSASRLLLALAGMALAVVLDTSALVAVALLGAAGFGGYLTYCVACWRALSRWHADSTGAAGFSEGGNI